MSRSNRWMLWLFGAITAIILVLKFLSLYADYCWFEALGQAAVFTTILWTRVKLGAVIGGAFFLWLWLNARLARRPLPPDVVLIGRRLLTDEEREQVEQYLDKALLIFCIMGGLMVALVASGRWIDWIHFRNPVPFGYSDPLFHRDAGFYVFRLNMLLHIWRLVFYGFALAFMISVLVYFYQEAIRIVGNTVHALPTARAHTFALLAGALLTKAVGYRLDQFQLVFSPRAHVLYGAGYADVHARLPVLWILIGMCVVGAGVILASIRGRRFLWPGGALAVILVTSILGGAAYPALVQRLVVKPNEFEKQKKYIAYNIEATNVAYGLTNVRDERYTLRNDLTWEDLQRNWATIENIRLWDHRPLEQTYQHVQALRPYYTFPDVDVDRYVVDGRYRQVMLAPRQLDYSMIPEPKTWVKTHLQYTHGYGLCLSPVNKAGPEGLPEFWIKDIPPQAKPELKVSEPGLYYMASLHPRLIEYIMSVEQVPEQPRTSPPEMEEVGEEAPRGTRSETARTRKNTKEVESEYVIVNSTQLELDYPRIGAQQPGGTNVLTKYGGKGGTPAHGFLRRLAFAAKFMDIQILLTDAITEQTKIIFNRYVPERFAALAPWLMYDPDPYLVIHQGHLVWMCDAYTVSNRFPYSRPVMSLVNYIRNSVKIVCDAYDGIPQYYVFDPSDPMIQCYMKVFPTLFKPFDQMPEDLKKHIRYPQLLFMLQVQTYADYHMKDPSTFYQREDSWSIPIEKYSRGHRLVEAYYVVMTLPGETKPEFLLMIPLTLRGREERNMVAWMAARCDPPHYGELIVYRLPKEVLCYGPYQIEIRIDQNGEFSQLNALWDQKGSRVIRGNLLAIPIDHSMLYVEPLYLVSSQEDQDRGGLPELRRVIVAFGDRLAIGYDLEDALAKLFGQKPLTPTVAAEEPVPAVGAPAGGPALPRSARGLLERALELDDEAQRLLRSGDLAGYQRKQQEQRQVLEQLRSVLGEGR